MSALIILIIIGSVLSTIFVISALILSSRVSQAESFVEEQNQINLSRVLSSQQPAANNPQSTTEH